MDWYSDVVFTFTLVDCSREEAIYLFVISFCLLAFPLIFNVWWLVKNQHRWETDIAVGPRLNGWLRRWRPYLFGGTILSGSAFGTVNLCNSNMFGYPLFRMGLKTRLQDQFDSKRLWIVVAIEVELCFVVIFFFFSWRALVSFLIFLFVLFFACDKNVLRMKLLLVFDMSGRLCMCMCCTIYV